MSTIAKGAVSSMPVTIIDKTFGGVSVEPSNVAALRQIGPQTIRVDLKAPVTPSNIEVAPGEYVPQVRWILTREWTMRDLEQILGVKRSRKPYGPHSVGATLAEMSA